LEALRADLALLALGALRAGLPLRALGAHRTHRTHGADRAVEWLGRVLERPQAPVLDALAAVQAADLARVAALNTAEVADLVRVHLDDAGQVPVSPDGADRGEDGGAACQEPDDHAD